MAAHEAAEDLSVEITWEGVLIELEEVVVVVVITVKSGVPLVVIIIIIVVEKVGGVVLSEATKGGGGAVIGTLLRGFRRAELSEALEAVDLDQEPRNHNDSCRF